MRWSPEHPGDRKSDRLRVGKAGAFVIVNYNGSKEKAEETVAEIRKTAAKRFPMDAMSPMMRRVGK